MKIVGVVSEYKEALEIEDIVKIFLIEQRILDLLSLKQDKNQDTLNSNVMILPKKKIDNFKDSDENLLHAKADTDSKPVFNVRGLF